jgi:VWFA-related protein
MGRRLFSATLVFIGCALIIMSAGAPGFSQSPSQSPPKQDASQSGTLRVTSRLVQVDVSVLDKDGNQVTGLTKDDFTIFDQGQRQQIATFSAQASLLVANAGPPNVFSNRDTPPADSQPPLTVIVMDVYNSRLWDTQHCPPSCAVGPMFEAVRKFIRHMQPQDRVALYVVDEINLYLLQDFTSDAESLLRELKRGEWYVPASIFPTRAFTSVVTPRTMEAMRTISVHLKSVPGRKNIIWLSSGFPVQPSVRDPVVDAAKALGDGALPLTAINPLGLSAPGGLSAETDMVGKSGGLNSGMGGPTPASGNYGGDMSGGPAGVFGPLAQFALATGGSAISHTNDIAGAIQRVVDRSSNTYLLGYYPGHNKWNGEFREIKVRVNRPGVEAHARLGYYAVADIAPAPQLKAQRLVDAIRSPLEVSDLTFDIQADSVGTASERQLTLKITFDPAQLHFQKQTDRWTDNIAEVWAEFGPEGREISRHSQTLNLKPLLANYQQFLQKPFSYSETITVSKSADRLRLILRDENTGAIGSVTIPLIKLFPEGPEQQRPRN